ncbi:MAG: hypothetical protein V3S20_11015, partial [Dehalococcoidia bacterium]
IMDSVGGIETLRLIHHIAGGVLIFAGFYHVALVLVAVLIFRMMTPLQMIPDGKDLRDALQMTRYFLGLRQQRTAFSRPSYFQKLDYWVIVWSMVVMGSSGLIALFPVRAVRFVSGESVLAALGVHSDSAMLVVAWVLLIHLIYAGLAPALFPHRAAFLSGESVGAQLAVPPTPEPALTATTGAAAGDPDGGRAGHALLEDVALFDGRAESPERTRSESDDHAG